MPKKTNAQINEMRAEVEAHDNKLVEQAQKFGQDQVQGVRDLVESAEFQTVVDTATNLKIAVAEHTTLASMLNNITRLAEALPPECARVATRASDEKLQDLRQG